MKDGILDPAVVDILEHIFITDNPKPYFWYLQRSLDPPPIFKLLQPHSLGDIPTPIESLLYGRWITFWDMRKRSIDIASMYPNVILIDDTPSAFPKVCRHSYLFGRGACL